MIPSRMDQAYEQACLAFEKGEVPIGAALFLRDQVVAQGHNQSRSLHSFLHHAELLVLQEASVRMDWWQDELDLYVTLEPCLMCSGAIQLSRVRRLYFGGYRPKGGCVDHFPYVLRQSPYPREVIGGIQEARCTSLLHDFFARKRSGKSRNH
jgi:tRNA(adenine34) deaminase